MTFELSFNRTGDTRIEPNFYRRSLARFGRCGVGGGVEGWGGDTSSSTDVDRSLKLCVNSWHNYTFYHWRHWIDFSREKISENKLISLRNQNTHFI